MVVIMQYLNFPNTTEKKYYFLARISKKTNNKKKTHKILIESPFSHRNYFALLAALNFFNVLDDHLKDCDLISGLGKSYDLRYIDQQQNEIWVEDLECLTDSELSEIESSPNFYSLAATLNPFYKVLTQEQIYTREFLKLRNYHLEFAAIIGTINTLAVNLEQSYKDDHLNHIILAVNQVFLMGYPPKRTF
jgi:hypothetical protein